MNPFHEFILKGNKHILYTILLAIVLFSWIYIKLFAHCLLTSKTNIIYHVENNQKKSIIDLNHQMQKTNNKLILIWDSREDLHLTSFQTGTKLFEQCRQPFCEITNDESELPIEYYDAIIINANKKLKRLPELRKSEQIYIFYAYGFPKQIHHHKAYQNSFINWTMTHRTDSDIYYPLAEFIKQPTDYDGPNNKTNKKLIVWFNDKDNYTENMAAILKQLKNFLDINVIVKTKNSTIDYGELAKNYKFILLFQKQDCLDYISEEMYKVLHYDIIPVVFGMALSHRLLPHKSVIFAEEYHDSKSLATYLKYVNRNNVEYLSYFEWKKDYIIEYSRKDSYCQLCSFLNSFPIHKKIYTDVQRWWYSIEICTNMYAFLVN